MNINKKTIYALVGAFTLGAAASGALAAYISIKKESKRCMEEINRMLEWKREKELFHDPNEEQINKFTADAINGVAHQLEFNNCDGFGDQSRRCAVIILRRIAQCMQDGENLSDFEDRTENCAFDEDNKGFYLL